jgi:hypothetical protein
MALIVHPSAVDTREVARRVKIWFDEKGFETKAFGQDNAYLVKARKSSTLRSVIGADRAIEVGVRAADGETRVNVCQGSWKTIVISNAAWLFVTGGINLAISGWSLVIQKDLEGYVREILEELSAVG